ncbi:MAG: hypothetical protein KC593_25260 [Myxococcales bacterium]|nr:hypothetical protein [Myxococcales bacterium]MCB9628728.1 hypothetical protein [Sandaracinaceae bacterium]
MRGLCVSLGFAASVFLCATAVHAQAFELPPDPRDRPPAWNVEPRLELDVPLVTRRLCPDNAACIYGSGFGLGALVERRYRSGVGLGAAYDMGFMGGDNVFELSTLQKLSVSFRYFFMLRNAAHPFVGVEVGGVLFGDTFRVSTGGFHVDGRAGVEIEATNTLSFTLYGVIRALYTAPFTSQPDGLRRSHSGGMDLTFNVGAGLALRFGP